MFKSVEIFPTLLRVQNFARSEFLLRMKHQLNTMARVLGEDTILAKIPPSCSFLSSNLDLGMTSPLPLKVLLKNQQANS